MSLHPPHTASRATLPNSTHEDPIRSGSLPHRDIPPSFLPPIFPFPHLLPSYQVPRKCDDSCTSCAIQTKRPQGQCLGPFFPYPLLPLVTVDERISGWRGFGLLFRRPDTKENLPCFGTIDAMSSFSCPLIHLPFHRLDLGTNCVLLVFRDKTLSFLSCFETCTKSKQKATLAVHSHPHRKVFVPVDARRGDEKSGTCSTSVTQHSTLSKYRSRSLCHAGNGCRR